MPLVRVQHYPGFKQVLIAADNISQLAVVEISTVGARYVDSYGSNPQLVVGVSNETVLSGQPVRIVTHGFVSGLICFTAVNAGDRIGQAQSGQVQSLNTIPISAPLIDLASGITSGSVAVGVGKLVGTSGLFSGLAGIRSGLAPTGFMLGRAFTSGGAGSGIQALIEIE